MFNLIVDTIGAVCAVLLVWCLVRGYLRNLKSSYINLFEKGTEYESLPSVLSKYHIGVILYKGRSKNYEFNAPNKLFEYLTCGLDVWFPIVMKGVGPYIKKRGPQKVIPINFAKLYDFKWENMLISEGIENNPPRYSCDTVFENIKKILER